MPRALAITKLDVPLSQRDTFLERARRGRAHFAASGCNYWLFADPLFPESYVEFVESRDAAALRAALLGAPLDAGANIDREHILTEVELP